MGGEISKMAKQELWASVGDRYQQTSKKDKRRDPRRIHRDHRPSPQAWHSSVAARFPGKRQNDSICRLAYLRRGRPGSGDRSLGGCRPHLRQTLEGAAPFSGIHRVPPEPEARPRSAPPSVFRQCVHPGPVAEFFSETASSRRRSRRRQSLGPKVPGRVYAGWDRPPPVSLEIDMVAHCGGSLVGSYLFR